MTDSTSLETGVRILEGIAIIGGWAVALFKMGGLAKSMEKGLMTQQTEISEMKADLKALNKLMTDVALQQQRLDSQDRRLEILDSRYDELRRGEGLITKR